MATKAQATVLLSQAIRPALTSIKLWSPAAEELLLGTAIVESDLLHRKQFAGGPARGLFQMELRTHDDIWDNYLKYHSELSKSVGALMSSPGAKKHVELETNDKYASAMVRVHYQRRSPGTLPQTGDIDGMATFWKRYYNTTRGKGDVDDYRDKWKKVIGATT
jgi:hypothetical protein